MWYREWLDLTDMWSVDYVSGSHTELTYGIDIETHGRESTKLKRTGKCSREMPRDHTNTTWRRQKPELEMPLKSETLDIKQDPIH